MPLHTFHSIDIKGDCIFQFPQWYTNISEVLDIKRYDSNIASASKHKKICHSWNKKCYNFYFNTVLVLHVKTSTLHGILLDIMFPRYKYLYINRQCRPLGLHSQISALDASMRQKARQPFKGLSWERGHKLWHKLWQHVPHAPSLQMIPF